MSGDFNVTRKFHNQIEEKQSSQKHYHWLCHYDCVASLFQVDVIQWSEYPENCCQNSKIKKFSKDFEQQKNSKLTYNKNGNFVFESLSTMGSKGNIPKHTDDEKYLIILILLCAFLCIATIVITTE